MLLQLASILIGKSLWLYVLNLIQASKNPVTSINKRQASYSKQELFSKSLSPLYMYVHSNLLIYLYIILVVIEKESFNWTPFSVPQAPIFVLCLHLGWWQQIMLPFTSVQFNKGACKH
jgi:hypothetical protein